MSYDGIWPLGGTGNPYQICSKNNGAGTSPTFTSTRSNPPTVLLNQTYTFDEAAFDCTLTALPAVPVPAL